MEKKKDLGVAKIEGGKREKCIRHISHGFTDEEGKYFRSERDRKDSTEA